MTEGVVQLKDVLTRLAGGEPIQKPRGEAHVSPDVNMLHRGQDGVAERTAQVPQWARLREMRTGATTAVSPTSDAQAPAKVRVVGGNIVQMVPLPDAIITPIHGYHPKGWSGGIDKAIMGEFGTAFHRVAAVEWLDAASQNKELPDGHVIRAHSDQTALKNVIFVIDNAAVLHVRPDLEDKVQDLSQVVLAGLREAEKAGLKSVALPAMRTGCAAGAKEKTPEAVAKEMARGIALFLKENPRNLKDISVVVFRNPELEGLLRKAMQEAGGTTRGSAWPPAPH